jgi:hypothetical protein
VDFSSKMAYTVAWCVGISDQDIDEKTNCFVLILLVKGEEQ